MINLSSIKQRSFAGRLLRAPLGLVPGSLTVPICQGPLRGFRWVVGSSVHGCWLGTYEIEKVLAVARASRPGMVAYDIGAHAGYYTLAFAHFVGRTGAVYAFEPYAENLARLRRHLALNRVSNVRVLPMALADRDGTARFAKGGATTMGHLSETGETVVRCATLDTLIETADFAKPHILKIDAEGAEGRILVGARRLLERFRPLVFVATHGDCQLKMCSEILNECGYDIAPLDSGRVHLQDEFLARPVAALNPPWSPIAHG